MPVGRNSRPTERTWCPAADVLETGSGWLVKFELAGVSPDELEIIVQGRTLHISGVRRDAFYTEGYTYHQMEITYSRFYRKLQFPCDIAGAEVERHYRDGLLLVYLKSAGNCADDEAEKKQKSASA